MEGKNMTEKVRCGWVGSDSLMVRYHDEEWGVPLRDEDKLFEFLILEGAQAGLSWQTILRKRENYRAAFDNFDPEKISLYGDDETARLLADPGIVRNRLKIAAAIGNARACLQVKHDEGSFADFLWAFVGDAPVNRLRPPGEEAPATSPESEAMSRELRRRGFRFVGPTICYAFMQAAGLANDHETACFRRAEIMEGARHYFGQS